MLMHSTEREQYILGLLQATGFVSFRQLEKEIDASPATLRRDLERMSKNGVISRVRGGAKLISKEGAAPNGGMHLRGVPFDENVALHRAEKEAIGRAAAALCTSGEGVMIDGGSTTLQMCPHLEGLNLQVLTNSLHIVNALLPQPDTRILVPAGSVFREQSIILAPTGDDAMPRFHGPKLFMGAASIGAQGIMQDDIVLVAAERRLIERAEELIVLVDSSKFAGPSGSVVCGLDEISTLITDDGIDATHRRMLEKAGIQLIVVSVGAERQR
ncbi:MAG: DeoR/GlpR family DNA-binding transcription regulator [Maricaulaceae bacterium]|jgi:DeoR family ulaG and ulaABCDEF operon transcriptional repressor